MPAIKKFNHGCHQLDIKIDLFTIYNIHLLPINKQINEHQ